MAGPAAVFYDSTAAPRMDQGPCSPMGSDSCNWTWTACTRYDGELLAFLTAKLRCPHEAADRTQETYARLPTAAFLFVSGLTGAIISWDYERSYQTVLTGYCVINGSGASRVSSCWMA